MNPLDRILERKTIQTSLSSNENEIFEGRITNGDFSWLIEQAEKLKKVEKVMGLSHADSFDRHEAIEEIRCILEFY